MPVTDNDQEKNSAFISIIIIIIIIIIGAMSSPNQTAPLGIITSHNETEDALFPLTDTMTRQRR